MTAATAIPPDAPLSVVDDPIEQGRYTRWVTGAAGERLGESSLQLSGMYCAACAGLIEHAIHRVDGVRSVQVSAAAQRATVCWDPERTRPSALIEAVRGAGYDAVPDAAAPARALRRREHRQALWRLVGVHIMPFLSVGLCLGLALFHLLAGGAVDDAGLVRGDLVLLGGE